jgi:hypothetical protein
MIKEGKGRGRGKKEKKGEKKEGKGKEKRKGRRTDFQKRADSQEFGEFSLHCCRP